MAKKFLTPINLPSGTVNPSYATTEDLFYRTDLSAIVSYDGTQWVPLIPGTSTEDVVEILAEFGLVGGDSGEANTIFYVSTVDGGTPGTTEFLLDYSGEEV
jgi:hypothetical protein